MGDIKFRLKGLGFSGITLHYCVHLSDLFCKLFAFGGRDPTQLQALRGDTPTIKLTLPVLKAFPGESVSVVIMAIRASLCQSASRDELCPGALLESPAYKVLFEASRAHGANHPRGGGVLAL